MIKCATWYNCQKAHYISRLARGRQSKPHRASQLPRVQFNAICYLLTDQLDLGGRQDTVCEILKRA